MTATTRFPTTRSLTTAETAKEIRKALKAKFAGTKFSVRSHNYAGGCSIRIGWTDGPTEQQIKAATNIFQSSDFDGMTDSKSYRDDVMYAGEDGTFETISYSADHVFTNREISAEWRAEIAAMIEAATGEPCNLGSGYEMPDANSRYDAYVTTGYGEKGFAPEILAVENERERGATLLLQYAGQVDRTKEEGTA